MDVWCEAATLCALAVVLLVCWGNLGMSCSEKSPLNSCKKPNVVHSNRLEYRFFGPINVFLLAYYARKQITIRKFRSGRLFWIIELLHIAKVKDVGTIACFRPNSDADEDDVLSWADLAVVPVCQRRDSFWRPFCSSFSRARARREREFLCKSQQTVQTYVILKQR